MLETMETTIHRHTIMFPPRTRHAQTLPSNVLCVTSKPDHPLPSLTSSGHSGHDLTFLLTEKQLRRLLSAVVPHWTGSIDVAATLPVTALARLPVPAFVPVEVLSAAAAVNLQGEGYCSGLSIP